MLLIEYFGHIGLRSLNDGHLGRHLEYFKTLNDARVASVGFIKYKASTTRINKEKNFKIKFQVILVFYRTKRAHFILLVMIKMPFLLLNNPNDINCGHVRNCVMLSIIFWTIYLLDLARNYIDKL